MNEIDIEQAPGDGCESHTPFRGAALYGQAGFVIFWLWRRDRNALTSWSVSFGVHGCGGSGVAQLFELLKGINAAELDFLKAPVAYRIAHDRPCWPRWHWPRELEELYLVN
jgi:hypothetical protein